MIVLATRSFKPFFFCPSHPYVCLMNSLGLCAKGPLVHIGDQSYKCNNLARIMRMLNHTRVDIVKADVEHAGVVSFDNYRGWVMQNPTVIVFFQQLSQSIAALLHSSGRTSGSFGVTSVVDSMRCGAAAFSLEKPVSVPPLR